jgi:MoaA/NifB/PqqE/SkfB family radical SAM enzyme
MDCQKQVKNKSYIVSITSKGLEQKSLVLRISEKCNNNCIFCFVPHHLRNQRFLTLEETKKLIDSQTDKKMYLEIGGAEPTLHPQFFEILEYIRNREFEIVINSNARLFSYVPLVERLKQIGNIRIKSSLHGHTAKIHDSLTRTSGSFNQAIKGFENLIKNEIPLMVNIVINKKNVFNLKEIVDLLFSIGVREISFSGLLLTGDFHLDKLFTADLEDIRKNLPGTLEYALKKGIKIVIEKLPICVAPQFSEFFLIDVNRIFFVRPEQCLDCKFKSDCMGVHRDYIKEGFPCCVYPQCR